MIGIYKITNPTNKINIGQSWDIEQRKKHYSKLNCKGQTKLYNSLKKYGWEAHKFEVIHELPEDITQEQLNQYEINYWKQYINEGFEMLNIKEPGIGGKWNDEMKQNFKTKRNTTEWKNLLSITHKGKTVSENTRDKISQSLTGFKQSEDTILKRGIKNKQTDERINERSSKISKPIICINDNNKFDSIKKASIYYQLDAPSIGKVCRGINKHVNKLKFKFL